MGFEKISQLEFIGGYIHGEVQQLYIEEDMGAWVSGGPQTSDGSMERVLYRDRDPQTGIYKGLAYNGHSSSHQLLDNAINILLPQEMCAPQKAYVYDSAH